MSHKELRHEVVNFIDYFIHLTFKGGCVGIEGFLLGGEDLVNEGEGVLGHKYFLLCFQVQKFF